MATGEPRRTPYPPEFRARAVELARTSGLSPREVARDLGVDRDTIARWLRQADVDAGRRPGVTTDERAELARLRRENALLKEERESLRKATEFVARRSATR
jgi:transposase